MLCVFVPLYCRLRLRLRLRRLRRLRLRLRLRLRRSKQASSVSEREERARIAAVHMANSRGCEHKVSSGRWAFSRTGGTTVA